MKKSIFTLLAIATAVFTMSSCSQDGGSSNDLNIPDSSNQPNQAKNNTDSNSSSTTTSDNATYKYQVSASNDVFEFFDVTITRTVAGQSTNFTLTNPTQIILTDIYGAILAQFDGKTMERDIFQASKDAEVKITARIDLKKNWKEIVANRQDSKVNFKFELFRSNPSGTSTEVTHRTFGSCFKGNSELTQDNLLICAANITKSLNYSNKK